MSVAEQVKEIIIDKLGVDANQITDDASFIDDLGADSLATAELVMEFEEKFGIDEIPPDEADNIRTVKEAISYIEKKLAEK